MMHRGSFFVVFIVFSCLHEGYSSTTIWKKLNIGHEVCFEGKGDKPGHVRNFGENKLVGAIKLVYKSGSIRCALKEAYESRWGCYQTPGLTAHPLNVVITDDSKNVMFPLERYLNKKKFRPGLWYYLPFTDPKHSDEIVFANYMDPFYLPSFGQLSIWYGEDLKNWYERDNIGKVCVDVYIHYQI